MHRIDTMLSELILYHYISNLIEFMRMCVLCVCGMCPVFLILQTWKELDSRITDGTNEAKDNVKFLYTLEKYVEPLYNCNPVSMLESIPGLMNAIRMINNYSRFYNTSERMTALFVKVTNQMVTACKLYITDNGYKKFWELDHPVVLERMSACVRLNDEYQKCYHRTKVKVAASPDERNFDFSEVYMFGRLNKFCNRSACFGI